MGSVGMIAQDDVGMAIVWLLLIILEEEEGNKMFSAMFHLFFGVVGSALDGPV